MCQPQELNPLYQFLNDFEDCLTRIVKANGFGRVGIVIEMTRNKKGQEKKFALTLEGQPSYRYVFNQEQFYELVKTWKSQGDSESA